VLPAGGKFTCARQPVDPGRSQWIAQHGISEKHSRQVNAGYGAPRPERAARLVAAERYAGDASASPPGCFGDGYAGRVEATVEGGEDAQLAIHRRAGAASLNDGDQLVKGIGMGLLGLT
jgi:hypothetical protein